MAWRYCLLGPVLFFGVLDGRVLPPNETAILSQHKRSSRCYGELGCFDTGGPFFSLYRPINVLPFIRSAIDTRFYLFTRENPNNLQSLKAGDANSIKTSNFKASRPTKIICHGFLENGKVKWMMNMKDAFLKQGDYNVINIDWGGGSLPPYTQATANARLVGAEAALLINYLKDNFDGKPETFHLLGHSLGAHIAGYAGERVQYVGRITGLDPAGPYYENTDPVVRLDPGDALFVDTIHTDGQSILKLGYGMKEACGHADYYPNGGANQPGCGKDPVTSVAMGGLVEGTKQFVACNHLRSYALFTESINSRCPFEGFRCDSYDSFKNGRCIPCKGENCGYMGFHADKAKPPHGQSQVKFFFNTFDRAPFCAYHHQIQFSTGTGRKERGMLYMTLIGRSGRTEEYTLTPDNIDINPETTTTYMVLSRSDLGEIREVEIRWKHDSAWYKPLDWNILGLRHPTISVPKVVITSGESSAKATLCDKNGAIETDKKRVIFSDTSC